MATKTFIGTHLDPGTYRDFRVKAAQLGLSASGLLRKLALAEAAKVEAVKPPQKKGQR